MICVDGCKGIVLDYMEEKPMFLCRELFSICVGDGFVLDCVDDIRDIELEESGGKNMRTKNVEKRSAKRHCRREAKNRRANHLF